ncbi:bone marrow stromal antigen 2 isoform X1 [Octodon degus]|uniref:Bone marrow stromal antigen 2 isoform X1 n=1 Tax=Octodon degus TaxID=10160 RepID=A0A6P6DUL4_OCTDE|nr:bone marrow stromal antigen 2 isoform X1 [Octodon degus]
MPASLYHYLPVPMDEAWKEKDRSSLRLWLQGRRTWVLVILVILVILSMAVPLGHFAVQANSEACQHGLREEKQWRNTTQHLRDQLARAQEALLDADATCNSTVENLTASLSQMKTLQQKQQEQVQSLQRMRSTPSANVIPKTRPAAGPSSSARRPRRFCSWSPLRCASEVPGARRPQPVLIGFQPLSASMSPIHSSSG